MTRWTFTSESVTEGHPDKMADQISDSILDAILGAGPDGPGGLRDAGHHRPGHGRRRDHHHGLRRHPQDRPRDDQRHRLRPRDVGFDGNTCGVVTSIDQQSPDIAQGVDTAYEIRTGSSGEDVLNSQGAGDQGMMFGYACDETDDLMPLPIWLAHRLAERLAEVRKAGVAALPAPRRQDPGHLRLRGRQAGRAAAPCSSPPSTSPASTPRRSIKPDLIEHVIRPLLPAQFADDDFRVLRQPDRQLRARRPARRLPASPAARSSSTPTAAWPATAAAPSPARTRPRSTARPPTPPAGWPRTWSPPARPTRCEVQVAYAIGVAQPGVAAGRDVRHRDGRPGQDRRRPSREVFDLRPAAIIRDLDLRRPIYQQDRGLRPLRPRRPGLHLGAAPAASAT